MLGAQPEYRVMISVDIERSAGRGSDALSRVREALFTALRETCTGSGIDWEACHRRDTGDGMIIVGPRELAKSKFIYPFTNDLTERLRAHNRVSGPPVRFRVRMAMHAGDVSVQDGTVSGSPFEFLARMLDAPLFKRGLAASPESTTVGLIVSPHIYDDVVRNGYVGIDPGTFRRVKFTVKETTAFAWVQLPAQVPVEDQPAPATGNQYKSHVRAKTAYTVQGGDLHIGR